MEIKGYVATTLSATGNRLTKGQLKVELAVLLSQMILTSLNIMTRYLSTLMIRQLLLLYGRRYVTPISYCQDWTNIQIECLAIQANVKG